MTKKQELKNELGGVVEEMVSYIDNINDTIDHFCNVNDYKPKFETIVDLKEDFKRDLIKRINDKI